MAFNFGALFAATAFIIYGLYPLYFKQIENVPAFQVALHRVVWSVVTLLPIFLYCGDWSNFRKTALKPGTLAMYFASAVCMGSSYILFLWGIMAGYVIETSLGYFMNPIFSVVLAVVVLKESLRFWQRISVALACAGVLVVAIAYGKFPWLGVCLGTSVALYGFLKKTSPLSSLDGVMLEISFLFAPSLITLIVLEVEGSGAFISVLKTSTIYLLIGSGSITIIPLLLFATAAQRISFTMLGLVQYVGPITTFLLGVFVYKESFSTSKLIGFILVWLALTIFVIENIIVSRYENSPLLLTVGDESDPDTIQTPKEFPFTPTNPYNPQNPVV